MKKKALQKDFIIEVKKSKNRFFSIMLIGALGVAFYSGIQATRPDMQISADKFYDDTNLMDIRVLSSMGLTDEDVEAIEQVEGVKAVEPSYSVDLLCDTKSQELVVKVISQTEQLNQINLLEGRLPESTSECLVDPQFIDNTDYKVGDTINLRSGNDEDITESLNRSDYTIVGIGTTSYYLSLEKGSSSIGNGKINSFISVTPEAFNIDAYTEIYAAVDGAIDLTSYTTKYDDKVQTVLEKIEDIADERTEARYQQILEDPKKEIADAKDELAKEEAKAKEKLDDAAVQIEEGRTKLEDAALLLEAGKVELNSGKKEIKENKEKLLASEAEIKTGQTKVNTAKTKLEAGKKILKEKKQEYLAGVDSIASGYDKWNSSMEQWNQGNSEIEENEKVLNTSLAELLTQKTQLEPAKDLYPEQWQKIVESETILLAKQEELNSAKSEVEKSIIKLDSAKTKLDQEQEKLDAAKVLLSGEEDKMATAEVTLKDKEKLLQAAQKKIDAGWVKLTKAETDLQESETLLNNKETELKDANITLDEKEVEYKDAVLVAEEKIADGKQKIADGEAELAKVKYPKWYVLDRNSIQTYVEYAQDSERIGNIGKVFPAIFFLVAALVSLTTMTRMVEEQRTQIGTLKALGYSKWSIARKYILYAFLASMIGSILGVIIGEQVLPNIIINAYKILYTNLPVALTPINMYYGVISTLIAVLCTTLAAFLSCYKELMATSAQLMRPISPKLGKRVVLERIPWIWKNLNFSKKATVRNLFRYKKRFFMTVFGIGGCMALLLVGFGIKDSISAMSDIQYVELWYQDATITVNDETNQQEKEKLFTDLRADSRIEDVVSIKETTVDAGFGKVTKNTYLIVPEDTNQLKDYIVFRDRITHKISELQDDGVIITEKLARLLGASVGDTIYIKDSDVNQIEVKVTGIIENYMLHYIFMSPVTYGKLYGEASKYNKIYTKNVDNQETMEEELAADLLKLPSVISISFTSDLQNRIEDMLNSLNVVVYVLIISAGLLAFIVLYNLNNININERKRELATLKVLGFQDMEVANYVYHENIILTIFGTLTGIILGIILHRYVILTTEIDSFMFGRNIKLISYVYSTILTFGFSVFVNYFMYYKLKKIDMVESLKSVE